MADQVNYYEVLGVPREASQEEIRNAYRRLAKDRHPDLAGGSTQEFSLLQEAHAVLSDPNRRRQHDEALDLAHAADQLAGLDFGSMEDELAARSASPAARVSASGSAVVSEGRKNRPAEARTTPGGAGATRCARPAGTS